MIIIISFYFVVVIALYRAKIIFKNFFKSIVNIIN